MRLQQEPDKATIYLTGDPSREIRQMVADMGFRVRLSSNLPLGGPGSDEKGTSGRVGPRAIEWIDESDLMIVVFGGPDESQNIYREVAGTEMMYADRQDDPITIIGFIDDERTSIKNPFERADVSDIFKNCWNRYVNKDRVFKDLDELKKFLEDFE